MKLIYEIIDNSKGKFVFKGQVIDGAEIEKRVLTTFFLKYDDHM